jgi:hypothetical protein
MVNLILYVHSDKLIHWLTNKYIKGYLAFNEKFIPIEMWFLGSSILYCLAFGACELMQGLHFLHFLATHPIPVS